MSVGVAAGIILGQELGAGKGEVMLTASRLITFSVIISFFVGGAYFACASFIPNIYNTSNEIKELAGALIRIAALAMPLDAFAHASYFTLRSGGKTFVTFLFDSCFVWVVSVPSAFLLSRFTEISIVALFAVCQFENIIKDVIGFIFVRSGSWIRNIVNE